MSQEKPLPCENKGARLEVYEDPPGRWRFRLVNGNEEVVMCTRSVADEATAERQARTVRMIVPFARLCRAGVS